MPSLIDAERQYYVVKEKFWDSGSGDINDEGGATIGKMDRKFFSLRAAIDVTEADGTTLFTVSKKLVSLRTSYDIKDENDELLGRTKKKLLSFRPKMWMEDAEGRKLLWAQGSYMGWDFELKDNTGQIIGQVRKADRMRDVFLGGMFDFSDTYALQIMEPSFDRRLLLGMVIAIDNSVHDKKGSRGRGGGGFRFGR
ncbi:MAG: hypothetical protein HN929_03885 [Chloroflexi bacterium]|jgi:uncharacterized protein YxjI|nr:hypothetical protein [Chloroflexota bacterium]MBT7080595.1 hypothetical protein [Chloroflexota bacterium]MBT7290349.1 hypothetical protein [Chloroflexota bacterium]